MKTAYAYDFDERLVLRLPRLPLSGISSDPGLEELLGNEVFMEAIYLASPVLYHACIKYQERGQQYNGMEIKLRDSLSKYYLRMCNRSTPFGLFAACLMTRWCTNANGVLLRETDLRRCTRLDMQYLFTLATHLSKLPVIKKQLLFFPNNSLYCIGNEWRYVEYCENDYKRDYQISGLENTAYLTGLIRAGKYGMTYAGLVGVLQQVGVSRKEAIDFLDNCISSQVFVHELQPAITGGDFLRQLIETLERFTDSKSNKEIKLIIVVLKNIEISIQALDENLSNKVEKYEDLLQLIDTLGVAYEPGKVFQTDLTGNVFEGGLDQSLQAQLAEAIDVLKVVGQSKSGRLQQFVASFQSRYGSREISLLKVLDAECSIGYGTGNEYAQTPLLNTFFAQPPKSEERIIWGKWERLLQKKWLYAHANGKLNIELTAGDLHDFESAKDTPLSSIAVLFSLMKSKEVYLRSVGSSSAINLISRFAHAEPEINNLAQDIADREQAGQPNVVFAEIVHLSQARTGNILQHPAFRNYEIPYLAKSALPESRQLTVDDLYISVVNDQVVLRSRRLNKIVVPRLSNAHNFNENALPVYQFLCDLQHQEQKSDIHFSWGGLNKLYDFFPRVHYKNTIFFLATWIIHRSDIELLLKYDDADFKVEFENYRQNRNLPVQFMLADGDHELIIDTTNSRQFLEILKSYRYKSYITLKEVIEPAPLVTNDHHAVFAHQFLTFLLKKDKPRQDPQINTVIPIIAENKFQPGLDWIYLKIYCGIRASGNVLSNLIQPMMTLLLKKKWIKEWFFIHYTDPDFHIRLRLKLSDRQWFGAIVQSLYVQLQPEENPYVWKIQQDMYEREIGRYGLHSMAHAETIFYHDSVAVASFFKRVSDDLSIEEQWLFAIAGIDALLHDFGFDVVRKLDLIQSLKEKFAAEFALKKYQKQRLTKQYRTHKQTIDTLLNRMENNFSIFYKILDRRSEGLRPVISKIRKLEINGELEMSLNQLLSSYVHMHINRLIPASPRLHELVIYDLLFQHYKMKLFQNKQYIYQ